MPPGLPRDPTPDDRVRDWQRTGDIRHLWPDVTESALASAHRHVWGATAAILDPARGEATVSSCDAAEARAIGIAAYQAGMGPLLGSWAAEGRLRTVPPLTDRLGEHLDHGRRRAARFTTEASALLSALTAAGVPVVVLKGMHTGRVYFPEPACRVGGDVDLLVPGSYEARACAVLRRHGFQPAGSHPAAGKSTWNPPGSQPVRSLEVNHAENPWSVDLHTTLARHYYRGLRADVPVPWHALATVRIGATAAPVLPQPSLGAFLAVHTGQHLTAWPQLILVIELVLMLRRDFGDADAQHHFATHLAAHRLLRFAAPPLALADLLAPGLLSAALRAAVQRAVHRRWRRWLAMQAEAGLSPTRHRSLAEKLLWVRSPLEAMLLGSELLWGSTDTLESRRQLWRKRLDMLRRGLITVRPRRSGAEADE
jgi:hypothetical protein